MAQLSACVTWPPEACVIFSTPTTKAASHRPAATDSTAWRKAMPPGGAGALHLGAGYVLEPELVGDDACQNLLPAERAGDKIAEIDGADLFARHAGIPQRSVGRLDREAFQTATVVLPKGCRAYAGDCHLTHCRSPSGAVAGRS